MLWYNAFSTGLAWPLCLCGPLNQGWLKLPTPCFLMEPQRLKPRFIIGRVSLWDLLSGARTQLSHDMSHSQRALPVLSVFIWSVFPLGFCYLGIYCAPSELWRLQWANELQHVEPCSGHSVTVNVYCHSVSPNKLLINWKPLFWHIFVFGDQIHSWESLAFTPLDLSNIACLHCFCDQICHINQLVISQNVQLSKDGHKNKALRIFHLCSVHQEIL